MAAALCLEGAGREGSQFKLAGSAMVSLMYATPCRQKKALVLRTLGDSMSEEHKAVERHACAGDRPKPHEPVHFLVICCSKWLDTHLWGICFVLFTWRVFRRTAHFSSAPRKGQRSLHHMLQQQGGMCVQNTACACKTRKE